MIFLFANCLWPSTGKNLSHYDAFVSYRSCAEDQEFVTQTLQPKLEDQLKYRLCLHYKDFIAGEGKLHPMVNYIQSIVS